MTDRFVRGMAVYAAVVTALFVFAMTTKSATRNQDFDEITVHRIKVVEPDGTLRMVIANHATFPGVIVQGKEGAANRPQAGMLFYNDEGTENGGLIFAGHRDGAGRLVDSGVALSFDKYGTVGGQMVQLAGVSDSDNRFAGLRVNDNSVGGANKGRVWVGNGDDGAATVALMDMEGRKRIVMEVRADGASSLTFLDANGKALNQLVPSQATR